MGASTVQHAIMRASYRFRGSLVRIQINTVIETIAIIEEGPINSIDIHLSVIIIVYSAMKIIANGPLLYSVLNPDTSSLSPSEKSNGGRLVSAKIEIPQ